MDLVSFQKGWCEKFEHVGDLIRFARLQRNWTQSELGEKIGISDLVVSQIETGQQHASKDRLANLSKVLKCGWILSFEETNQSLSLSSKRVGDSFSSAYDPLHAMILAEQSAENVQVVSRLLSKITSRQRLFVKKKFFDNMSCADIAEEFNITRQSVRVTIAAALSKMRSILADWDSSQWLRRLCPAKINLKASKERAEWAELEKIVEREKYRKARTKAKPKARTKTKLESIWRQIKARKEKAGEEVLVYDGKQYLVGELRQALQEIGVDVDRHKDTP